jgi:hypothetical protein
MQNDLDESPGGVYARFLENTLHTMISEGWAVVCTNTEDRSGLLCYTVGLTALHQPELVLRTARDERYASALLNQAAGLVVFGGRRLRPGQVLELYRPTDLSELNQSPPPAGQLPIELVAYPQPELSLKVVNAIYDGDVQWPQPALELLPR